jgi:hypothetical protein
MFRRYWKFIWRFFRVGVMLWFVLMPLLPTYDWLSPWPEAEQKLEAEGLKGIKLMIGSARDSEREGMKWSEERQRSYVVLPASLQSMEIFTYVESRGSAVPGVERSLVRSHSLIPLLVLWVGAGWFSTRIVMSWIWRLKGPNKSLQATATALGN